MLTNSKTYGLQGASDLAKLLADLPEKMQKRVARYTGNRAAKIVQNAAEQKVPKFTGNLARSIIVRSSRKGDKLTMIVGLAVDPAMRKQTKEGGKAASKFGAIRDPWYGRLVELGSVHNTPQPFLGPALEENAQKVIDVYTEDMRQIIANAAAGVRLGKGLGRVD
jgi:HK97 gp10 family phage protein